MTLKYSHTQRGKFWFYLILVLLGIGIVSLFVTEENQEVPPFVLPLVIILYFYLLAFMSGLSVKIDDRFVRIAFGWFAFRKRFELSEIVDCKPVRNCWFWGWGIRFYLKGWLYNIDGLDAVEIHFANGKQARIGTDDPQGLSEAIQAALASRTSRQQ